MYESRVVRQIEAAHHNGPPGHKCEVNHGHTWGITVVFQYTNESVSNDTYGWGPEFGAVKKIIDQYDHQDLNDKFGPGIPPSAENLARVLYDQFVIQLGASVKYVQVNEGSGNSVRYLGH
jgi:6-pyruvoyl-tetrahydropterin synthase